MRRQLPVVAVISIVIVLAVSLAAAVHYFRFKPSAVATIRGESKTDRLAHLIDDSDRAAAAGDFKAALNFIDSAIEMDQNDSRLVHKRAELFMKTDDNDRAIAAFTKALVVNPYNDQTLLDRASCYYTTRAYQKAMADYQSIQAIKESHYLKEAKLGEALCHYSLGQYPMAIHQCRDLVKNHPDYIKAMEVLANSYLNQGSLVEAIDTYTLALRLDHGMGDLYYGRAVAYYKQHMPQKALEDLKKAVELCPNKTDYHLKLASVARILKIQDLEKSEARAVLKLAADNKEAQAILAK